MKYRIPLLAAGVTVVLLAAGLAWADSSGVSDRESSTSSSSSTSTTATTATPTTATTGTTSPSGTSSTIPTGIPGGNGNLSIPEGTSRIIVVGNAGTVLLGRSGNSLQIISATPNSGWSSEVEVGSGREVEGDFRNGGLRVKYNFELEDGVVRVRIENRAGDNDGDDGDNDDDNSGSGSGDDDGDDNSGSGSGDDDDDDNSGSGSGDDDDDNSGSGSGS